MTISQTNNALLVGTTGTGKTAIAEPPDPISSAKRAWMIPSMGHIHRSCRPP